MFLDFPIKKFILHNRRLNLSKQNMNEDSNSQMQSDRNLIVKRVTTKPYLKKFFYHDILPMSIKTIEEHDRRMIESENGDNLDAYYDILGENNSLESLENEYEEEFGDHDESDVANETGILTFTFVLFLYFYFNIQGVFTFCNFLMLI